MGTAVLPERLTLDEAAGSLASLRAVLASQTDAELRIDASPLQRFDSSAVAVLLELRRDALAQGKTLRVLHWPERLQALVALYGLTSLLPA